MKILHFITSIEKSAGGTTAYMQLISKELIRLVDFVIVTGISPNPIDCSGAITVFVNLSMSRWLSLEKEIAAILDLEKPDIVHVNGIWQPQTWLFQKVAQRKGIKVVLSPHGMLEPYIMNRHPLKKKIALALYQHKAIRTANYIHATATSELAQIRKLGYNPPATIIPNGIELTDLLPKTEWQHVRNILFLSRVHPKKGIELLIEALAQLNDKNIRVIVAGEGEAAYIESLKKLVVQKNVSQQVKFVGGVYGNRKWELYREADLFVLPTYSENFGIVVAEALATGLPVITTTNTPWKELETEKCGWWINLNVPDLAKALAEAIALQPEELKAMGLSGRKLVEDKYDIRAVSEKMVAFYKEVLSSQ